MTVLAKKLARAHRRKLLALDGGGIRGVMTLEVLRAIERTVRDASGRPQLVLGDYFDYIGGASTGAIIASRFTVPRSRAAARARFHRARPTDRNAATGQSAQVKPSHFAGFEEVSQ